MRKKKHGGRSGGPRSKRPVILAFATAASTSAKVISCVINIWKSWFLIAAGVGSEELRHMVFIGRK
ncbi:MAG: hypothetical protein HDT14_12985 [Oscillibacter sp.]|nr:hypothetical protein [Oscillibacter sp.]